MFKLLLSLDDELLKKVDGARSLHGTGRSEYIRRCIKEVLKIKIPKTKEEFIKKADTVGDAFYGVAKNNEDELERKRLLKEYPELAAYKKYTA